MSYSVGSSDVGDYEEDPNIPKGVNCGCGHHHEGSAEDHDDNISISSEISDQSMNFYGTTYDCKPDISEVANLTHAVNYGDLAMACHKKSLSDDNVLILDPVYSMEDAEKLTWSQLLDHEGRQPRMGVEQSTKSFIWTQGYNEKNAMSHSGGLSSVFPEPFSTPYKLTRRPSDMSSISLLGLHHRPRPLNAIKRFLSRRKTNRLFLKGSSFNTTETTNSTRQTEVAI